MSNIPEYTIELYQIDLTQNKLVRVSEIITYQGLTFSYIRNGIGQARFSLSLYDPKANPAHIIRFKTQVLIKRNGSAIWAGPIRKIKGNAKGAEGRVTIECLEYLSHFNRRFGAQFEIRKGDAGAIASDLIAEVQARTNGALFVQDGNIETIGDIQDTIEYKAITKVLSDQSDNLIGYDYEIVPILDAFGVWTHSNLNIYKQRGRFRNDLPDLSLQDNVLDIDFTTEGEIINSTTGLGAGTGTNVLTTVVDDNDSALGYTRREDIKKYGDENNENNLYSKTQAYVNSQKGEKYKIDIAINPVSNINYGDINLGDYLKVNLVIPNTFINFVGSGRVQELRIDIDNEGTERVSPKIDFFN